jgi:hypothetical protein
MPSIINATTTNGLVTSADNSGSLQFATNSGTTAVTIDTSQNVGVGASTLLAKFTVNGNQINYGTNPYIGLSNAYNDTASYIQYNTSSYALTIANSGNTGSNGYIVFNASGAERMRIGSGGDVLFGVTGTPSGSVGGAGFMADSNSRKSLYLATTSSSDQGLAFFINTNGAVGSIRTSGSGTSYVTTSDYRLKENVAPMTGALAKVSALKPVTYKWKVDGADGQGFIAHELAEVVPDCVTGQKDATEIVDIKDEEGKVIGQENKPVYQGIDTSFLVATLTAAIQELNAKVDAQAAEIQALKGVA